MSSSSDRITNAELEWRWSGGRYLKSETRARGEGITVGADCYMGKLSAQVFLSDGHLIDTELVRGLQVEPHCTSEP